MKYDPKRQANYEGSMEKFGIVGSHTCSPTRMQNYKRLEFYSS